MPNVLSGLTLVQTVSKGDRQTALVGTELSAADKEALQTTINWFIFLSLILAVNSILFRQ